MSLIVADVGCCTYDLGDHMEESIATLIERFHPSFYYGWDPSPDQLDLSLTIGGTSAEFRRAAAATFDGEMDFSHGGLSATVMRDSERWGHHTVSKVPCFDFSAWVASHAGHDIVVKLDCEGAEFAIVTKMLFDHTDRFVKLLLVEWHDRFLGSAYADLRANLMEHLTCPVEEWQ